jgi:hypothetical protein
MTIVPEAGLNVMRDATGVWFKLQQREEIDLDIEPLFLPVQLDAKTYNYSPSGKWARQGDRRRLFCDMVGRGKR